MRIPDASSIFRMQASCDPALIAGGLSFQLTARVQQFSVPSLRPHIYPDATRIVNTIVHSIVHTVVRVVSFVQFICCPKAGVIADAIAVVPQGPPIVRAA